MEKEMNMLEEFVVMLNKARKDLKNYKVYCVFYPESLQVQVESIDSPYVICAEFALFNTILVTKWVDGKSPVSNGFTTGTKEYNNLNAIKALEINKLPFIGSPDFKLPEWNAYFKAA